MKIGGEGRENWKEGGEGGRKMGSEVGKKKEEEKMNRRRGRE